MAKKPSSEAKNTPEKDVKPQDETSEEITKTTDSSVTSGDRTGDDHPKTRTDDTSKTANETQAKPNDPETSVTGSDEPKDREPDATEAQADTIEGEKDSADEAATATDDSGTDSATDDPTRDTDAAPVALPAPTAQPQKGPGAAPLVMGGIAAGAIGFAAAYFGLAQQPVPRDESLVNDISELSQRVEQQSGTIESLTEKVGGIANTDDTALEAQIAALGTLSERVADIENQLEAFDARLREVELRPVSESADAAAIAAYEKELNATREEITAQRQELQALIDEAMRTENAADEAARESIQRAAISRIQAALDSGTAFAGAVADLEATGLEVPEALTSVADTGVVALSSLQEDFPDAARAALNASRSTSGEGTGLTGFLRNQLGARSLEPREGDDPDAVLSRVEAAVRDGRLRDALAEMEALPEEGRAELSNWAGQLAQRLEALSAAQSLSETVN